MPAEKDTPTVGEQLEQALEETGISQRELAKRLAARDGTKLESKRRWILKLLGNAVDRPDMAEIEEELGLRNGYFSVPTLERQRRQRVRLAELEEEVARLRREHDGFVRKATARMARLEASLASPTQQSTQPSKRRRQGGAS